MSNEMNEPTNSKSVMSHRWLPNEKAVLKQWYDHLHKEIDEKYENQRHLVIQEFEQLIYNDPVVRMYMTNMIEQIPLEYAELYPPPKDLQNLLKQLNAVLTIAPPYIPKLKNPTPEEQEARALIGTPFSAILIWTMGTPAGFAAYRNEKINAMFKKLLCVWAGFLNSSESLYVLNDSETGWMCEEAKSDLDMTDYKTSPYIYKPDKPYWGFTSWNDFFTREVKEKARPIGKGVVAACDSTLYKISRDVQAQSEFWIKEQPYSLVDMLDNNYVEKFVGGDVWQAFLSPFNYHRWHSPIAGTIRKAYVKEGLYFSQATSEGEDPSDQDHSEGYIAHVQTRALFFIEADDKNLGMVCVMPIGMVEISSCVINEEIRPGVHVDKGQELGYFQFGGSTHCVVFQKGVIQEFILPDGNPYDGPYNVEVKKTITYDFGQQIAEAKGGSK